MNELKEITVKLRTPVRDDAGKMIRELTFREPTVDDMLTAEAVGSGGKGGELRATVAMLASMAGVEMAVMKRITRRDFQRITEACNPLLEVSEEEPVALETAEVPPVAKAV